jgi:hypothetical protein
MMQILNDFTLLVFLSHRRFFSEEAPYGGGPSFFILRDLPCGRGRKAR